GKRGENIGAPHRQDDARLFYSKNRLHATDERGGEPELSGARARLGKYRAENKVGVVRHDPNGIKIELVTRGVDEDGPEIRIAFFELGVEILAHRLVRPLVRRAVDLRTNLLGIGDGNVQDSFFAETGDRQDGIVLQDRDRLPRN